jgi:hypothetical protein
MRPETHRHHLSKSQRIDAAEAHRQSLWGLRSSRVPSDGHNIEVV